MAPSLASLKYVTVPADAAGLIICPHNDWTNEAAMGAFRRALAELRHAASPCMCCARPKGLNDLNDMVNGGG